MIEFVTENSALVALAIIAAIAIGFVLGYRAARANRPDGRDNLDGPPPVAFDAPRIEPDTRAAIEQALREGHKIEAIKIMREATGLSLNRAKMQVERMARGMPR